MMKLCTAFRTEGTSWDHQGKSEISQIFISTAGSKIENIQFAYVEDGLVVLSEKLGGGECSSDLQTITFDYPSEYLTRLNGCYKDGYLCSINFYTNKSQYGPYGPGISLEDFASFGLEDDESGLDDFDYKVGGKFWGFFGTYKSNGIESIGLYMKPLPLANQAEAARRVMPLQLANQAEAARRVMPCNPSVMLIE